MQPPTISVERVGADFKQWPELLQLIHASFSYMDGIIDPPSSAHRLTVEALREKAATGIGFVARVGSDLAGCAFLREEHDHFYLGKLAVAPSMQGKGLGKRLLAAIEAHAKSRGKPIIELQARIELTDNQTAFARLGFRETARTAHPGFNRPTSVTMRKVLG